MRAKLSRLFIGVAGGLFALGVVTGLLHYLGRSSTIERHAAGSSAIGVHVCLAVAALLLLCGVYFYDRRHSNATPLLLRPFSKTAASRFKQTILFCSGFSVGNLLRAVASLFLIFMLLYNFWRAGDQVFGGLDPNYVVNAWGGPSYWGASLAHWLDAALLFYLQAYLLHVVLLKRGKK